MEKILAQQADLLKKLETLSKQDRILQIAQTAELLGVDKDGDKQVEELQGMKESLDEGNKLLKEQITNLQKMVKGINNIDFNRITDLASKDVPLSIGDKLKEALGALNPLKAMDAVTSKFKNLFSTEKGRYLSEQTKEIRRKDPTISVADARTQATDDYNKALAAKKAQQKIDYAIQYDKDITAGSIPGLSKFSSEPMVEGTKADKLSVDEEEREAIKMQEEQTDLLRKIEENTRAEKDKVKVDPTKPEESSGPGFGTGLLLGGLIGTFRKKIVGFFTSIGASLLKGLRAVFSVRFLVGALKKVFLPVAIIGSIFSGVTDAIEEFKQSGSIGEALKAGLGGILDFLTFGLVNADTLTKLGEMINEYLIQPIKDFFKGIKDWVVEKASALPLVGDKIKEMFANPDSSEQPQPTPATRVESPLPTSATVLTRVSNETENARLMPATKTNNIVNAPSTTINTSTNNNLVKASVRNLDNSYNQLIKSKYSYI